MAKFLNTRKAVSEIEDLIRNADSRLILVSPYLKISRSFRELLTYRNNSDKITTIIFRKQELNPEEIKFLQGLRFISLKYNQDLHAKCYVNDNTMIITSLNLYEFSMSNNKEMGVLIDRNDPTDTQLFDDALKEVGFINSTSEKFEFSASQDEPSNSKTMKPVAKAIDTGYCIRTGVPIPFDIEKPFSYEAYKKWSEYSNPDYQEKFCHFSGEVSNGETSFSQPIMKKHWKEAKKKFNL
jgi:phosphatidylserine/phosphatidylglycerophosphate/cardiolipin synthase-like enzyme